MIVDELIKELQTYPEDWEVHIEVNGTQSIARDVDMESSRNMVAVVIHDYPNEPNSSRSHHS